jgi:membrane protease YdiL (CAAX protease family)
VVTQLLAERVGSRTAWIWAAALYAAAFAPTMLALRASAGLNPILCIAALGGALVWGGLARASGTLVSSVVAHALFDWAVLMMARYWGRAG